MQYFMPQITYHERKSLLSADFHPVVRNNCYRFVTSSVQHEVRIWEMEFLYEEGEDAAIGVGMVANLEGHVSSISQAKFSQNADYNLLASADSRGNIFIWKLSDTPSTTKPSDGFPPNAENWKRYRTIFHECDVTSICWSPCGKYLASVSSDTSLRVHEALTGRRRFLINGLRCFPNGVTYDPFGKYIVTMSTDRKMDLFCAQKGIRWRTFSMMDLPQITLGTTQLSQKSYQLFHDDLMTTFTRICSFSPCGELLVAPAGCLQLDADNKLYCSYVYRRKELDKDRPAVILQSTKPTFLIKFCPKLFELTDDGENYSGLPYKLVWLALTREEIIIYDSQHPRAIGLFYDLTYQCLSDAAWSTDGKAIIVTDMEEYIHYIAVDPNIFGPQVSIPDLSEVVDVFPKKTIKKKVSDEEAKDSNTIYRKSDKEEKENDKNDTIVCKKTKRLKLIQNVTKKEQNTTETRSIIPKWTKEDIVALNYSRHFCAAPSKPFQWWQAPSNDSTTSIHSNLPHPHTTASLTIQRKQFID